MNERNALEQDIDRWQGEGGGAPAEPRALRVGPPPAPASRLSHLKRALRLSRKIGVAAAGGGLLVLGVALIVLPGPAIIVIPLGLALLATEFPWAARLLRYLKERVARVVERGRRALARRSHT